MCSPQLPGTEGTGEIWQRERSGKEGEKGKGGPGLRRPFAVLDPANLSGTECLEHLNLPLKQGRRGTPRSLLQDTAVSRSLQVFLGYAGSKGKEPRRMSQPCLLCKQETQAGLSVLQLLCWWEQLRSHQEQRTGRGGAAEDQKSIREAQGLSHFNANILRSLEHIAPPHKASHQPIAFSSHMWGIAAEWSVGQTTIVLLIWKGLESKWNHELKYSGYKNVLV